MNWIKDNLIMVMAATLVVLGLTLVVSSLYQKARYAKLETKSATNAANFANAAEANKTANEVISRLEAANASLVAQMAADEKAAGAAAARTATHNDAIDRQAAGATARRSTLALENPNVASHLRTAVPCDVARSLWPEAGYCSP